MLKYLEQLRQRPERERRKAVFLISVGVTLVIAVIWGAVLAMRISGTDFSFSDKAAPQDMPSLSQTLSTFAAQVGHIMDNAAVFQNEVASSTAALTATGTQASVPPPVTY